MIPADPSGMAVLPQPTPSLCLPFPESLNGVGHGQAVMGLGGKGGND